MKDEYKRIMKVCKDLVGKEGFRKLERITDYKERTEGLKYLVDSKLRLVLLELESKMGVVDKKDVLILESKMRRLASKIKIFHSTYSKRDYLVLINLIKEVEGEIKHVRI